jgi:surface antigen
MDIGSFEVGQMPVAGEGQHGSRAPRWSAQEIQMPRNLIAGSLAVLLLAACAGPVAPDRNQQAGTVVGAVVGGLVGNQIGHGDGRAAATILGAIAGGYVGNQVGRYMDDTDRMRTAQVLETSPTGAPTHWRNPDTGREYTVVATRTYASAQGPCREYTMDAVIGGRAEKVYGTACRESDGSWRARN